MTSMFIVYLLLEHCLLGNVKLISYLALHGKNLNAQCAKIILFLLKKS